MPQVVRQLSIYPKLFWLFCFIWVFQTGLTAQIKQIGLPLITNFSQATYQASTQNWANAQNSLGFLYFANNDGLLEFDGQHWELYPVPNRSVVRSILAVNDTIYAGAFEQFGYFSQNKFGKLQYHSLVSLIPQEYRSFDEIWKIFKIDKGIVFQSFKYIFFYDGKGVHVVEPETLFGPAYEMNQDIYVYEEDKGLLRIHNNETLLLTNDPVLSNNEIRCILPSNNGQLLIGFINQGLYLLQQDKLVPWEAEINSQLKDNNLFAGIQLSNGHYAFGSIQNGLYITDENGNVIQHLNRYKGLQNNTILSVFEDKSHNLWLGLDNGIDYIEINSPLSVYNHTLHIESTYASIVHNGFLYVGTNQGLFYASVDQLGNNQEKPDGFSLIQGTEGQVWKLDVIDNYLLCGHNFGCFIIEGNQAKKIDNDRGYWMFLPHNDRTDTLICGTYNGLNMLTKLGDSWQMAGKIEGFNESSRKFVQDGNTLWVAHGYRGLFKLTLDLASKKVREYQLYYNVNGLPDQLPYNIHKLGKDVVISSKSGFYGYDEQTNSFQPFQKYNQIFGQGRAIDNIQLDQRGNLWYFAFGHMGLMRLLEDGTYSDVTAPFLRINPQLIEAYETIYVHDNRNVFIGTKNGLLHYDPYFNKDYSQKFPAIFREIIFSGKDTLLNLYNVKSGSNHELYVDKKIPYDMNAVAFRFANPGFEAGGASLFSFRLKGFDPQWSDWDATTFKEYTNLPEGNYLFEVKVQTLFAPIEYTCSFAFSIKPPFYRSVTAYIIYVILIILIVAGNVFFIQKRIAHTKQEASKRLERELKEKELNYRELSLKAEKEIINLKNESLEKEVTHKNKELANTTLHLIHKNKILNAIKSQITSIIDQSLQTSKRLQLEQLVHRINKELKNEKIEKLFDEYFDDVHQDFINRLKNTHPDLSPRELRLCAYLRMNLSTKEIAPLLNISVRGVEIGRYRLRKKLNLEREDNLIDYLLKL